LQCVIFLCDHQVEEWESDWAQPQRVIQKRFMVQSEQLQERCLCPQDEDCRVEWYVKWKGLGYEHCTWEPMDRGVLATPIAARLFSDFKNWEDVARQRTTPEGAKEVQNSTWVKMLTRKEFLKYSAY
jgi:hypothetical protein